MCLVLARSGRGWVGAQARVQLNSHFKLAIARENGDDIEFMWADVCDPSCACISQIVATQGLVPFHGLWMNGFVVVLYLNVVHDT